MSQTPPGSLGLPFVGEALHFLKNPFVFQLARTKQHGNVWKTRILGDTVVFFAGSKAFSFFMNPENFTRENGSPPFLQAILHPDAVPFIDGERHATRKRLLVSAFTPAALETYLPSMFRVFERFTGRWAASGREDALNGDLSQLGFDLANTLFAAASPDTSNTEVCEDFTVCNRGTFSTPINLPFTAYGKAIRARDRLRAYIKQAVGSSTGEGSALGVLKAARGPQGEALSTEEIEIELLHFFFAAHGAITGALAWILVVLGQHPDLAARLRAEADAALGDGAPTLAQAESLPLARAVTREVLRAFPIAPTTFIGVAKKDLELDGMAIKAGWKGAGAIWATLQDGSQFQDPTAFKPDRLDDAGMKALPEHAWVPMSGGGHKCAGYALVNAVLPAFVGWFVKRYDLSLPAQDVSPGPGALGPLPADGLRARIARW